MTTTKPADLIGIQDPTFEHVPPGAVDHQTAEDAIELGRLAGLHLLPWQAEQVRRAFAQNPITQDWAATRFGLAVARQNGKGVVLEVIVLAKAVLLGERVLWTAHEVRTMQEAFSRFRALLEATPSLAALVKSSRVANGQESVHFTNGAEVKFSARSKSAVRGLGFRSIVLDEAQELEYLTLGAIVPTLSGQGDARTQLIVTGTPPYSAKGEVFADMRATAHTAGDPRLAWSEWAADPEDPIGEPATWARTNPSLGVVILADKVRDELATLAARPAVFRRERLGEWGRSADTALALDQARWEVGRTPLESWPSIDPGYLYDGNPARFLGIDSTFDHELTSIAEAVPLGKEKVGLRIVAAHPGREWITDYLDRLRSTAGNRLHVAWDPLRVGDLKPDLTAAGLRDARNNNPNAKRLHPATGRDLTLACDALVRAVSEDNVLHNDPRLDAAAASATRSTFDDGRGWKLIATAGGDVHVLIAAALALQRLRAYRPRASNRRTMVGGML